MAQFSKWHGLGNDFVLVDAIAGGELISPDEAIRVCDRHRGVGADGVLTLLPSEGAAARLHIYNPDGSVPEMCGNGARCAARHLFEKTGRAEVVLETSAGPRRCEARGDDVRVDMGAPTVRPSRERVDVGRILEVRRVSMGNPHAVVFVSEPVAPLAQELGPGIEKVFAGGVNVEFARRGPDGFIVSVWERGAGLTEACGTGACAVAAAAVAEGLVPAGVPVRIHLPGGTLTVEVAADGSRVWMTGPAVRVFAGSW